MDLSNNINENENIINEQNDKEVEELQEQEEQEEQEKETASDNFSNYKGSIFKKKDSEEDETKDPYYGKKVDDEEKLEAAIEAILFTFGDSVEIETLSKAVEYDKETIREYINRLNKKYQKNDRGIQIIELENSYQMSTKKEMYEYLIKITQVPKKHVLTDILLETLSIIAYKQPVTKLEIERIRGVGSGHSVNKLIEFGLVEELGRADAPGRPILFGTSEEFLRRFGISSLSELPSLDIEELEELKEEANNEISSNVAIDA